MAYISDELMGSHSTTTTLYFGGNGDAVEFVNAMLLSFPLTYPLTMTIRQEKLGASCVLTVTGESSVVIEITNYYFEQVDT